jgi:hypothetical protein
MDDLSEKFLDLRSTICFLYVFYELLKRLLRTAMYMLKIQIKILNLKLISDLGKKKPLVL